MEKEFKYFLIRDNGILLEIIFLFTEVTPEIEKEIYGILTTIYFGIHTHLRINLKDTKSLSLNMITFLLNLNKELNKSNRYLVINNPPDSLLHFFKHTGLSKKISVIHTAE